MSFIETLFNEQVAYGMVAVPQFNTSVIEGHSGREQRNAGWSTVRHRYTVTMAQRLTAEMVSDVTQLFTVAEGKLHGFRFKDWLDYKFNDQTLTATDDLQTVYPVIKRYTFGGVNYDRRLTKLVTDTVTVKIDGVPTTAFTVYPNTGHIMLSAPPGGSVVVTASGEFDVPVRFDTDLADPRFDGFDSMTWGEFSLVEVSREVEAGLTDPVNIDALNSRLREDSAYRLHQDGTLRLRQ